MEGESDTVDVLIDPKDVVASEGNGESEGWQANLEKLLSTQQQFLEQGSRQQLDTSLTIHRLVEQVSSASVKARGPTFPLPTFKGEPGMLEIFLCKLQRYCRDNECEERSATILLSALSDTVFERVHSCGLADQPDWQQLVGFLTQNFGDQRTHVDFENEVIAFQRLQGESLQASADRFACLIKKAKLPVSEGWRIQRWTRTLSREPWVPLLRNVISCKDLTRWEDVVVAAARIEKDWLSDSVRSPVACSVESTPLSKRDEQPVEVGCVSPSEYAVLLKQLGDIKVKLSALSDRQTKSESGKSLGYHEAPPSTSTLCSRQKDQGLSGKMCFACGGQGHFAKQCPSTCERCGVRGHLAKSCRRDPTVVPQSVTGAPSARSTEVSRPAAPLNG